MSEPNYPLDGAWFDYGRHHAKWTQDGFTVHVMLKDDESFRLDDYTDDPDTEEETRLNLNSGKWGVYGIVATASIYVEKFDSGYSDNKGPVKFTRIIELSEDSSWGIVVDGPTDEYLVEVAKECADQAVYQAKQIVAFIQALPMEVTGGR